MNKREIKKLLRGKTKEQKEQFLKEVNQLSSQVQILMGILGDYDSVLYLDDGLNLLFMDEKQLISKLKECNYHCTEGKYKVLKETKNMFDKLIVDFGLPIKMSMSTIKRFYNELVYEDLSIFDAEDIGDVGVELALNFLKENNIEVFSIFNRFHGEKIHYTAAFSKEEFLKRLCDTYFKVLEA